MRPGATPADRGRGPGAPAGAAPAPAPARFRAGRRGRRFRLTPGSASRDAKIGERLRKAKEKRPRLGAAGGWEEAKGWLVEAVGSQVFTAGAVQGDTSTAFEQYRHSLASLGRWVDNSLDVYRPDLQQVLWPLFASSYLEVLVLQSLGAVPQAANGAEAGPEGAEEGERNPVQAYFDEFKTRFLEHGSQRRLREVRDLAKVQSIDQFRDPSALPVVSKYLAKDGKLVLRMGKYAFNLLERFLQDNKFWLLLRLLNEKLEVQVVPGPSSGLGLAEERDGDGAGVDGARGAEEPVVLPGQVQKEIQLLNSQTVVLGLLAKDLGKPQAAAEAPAKAAGKPPAAKKAKAAKKASAAEGVRPWIPFATKPPPVERREAELAARAERVTPDAPPSVCMGTFLNARSAGSVCCAELSPDERYVAAGFSDSSVRVYPLGSAASEPPDASVYTDRLGALLRGRRGEAGGGEEEEGPGYLGLEGHAGPVYAASFSADWQNLYSASGDGTVRLWSLELGAGVMAYRGHAGPVWAVAASPLQPYFASGGWDGAARVWSTEHAAPLRLLAGHAADVDCLGWHPNGHYLATGSSDRTVRLFDVNTGRCTRLLAGKHRDGVTAVAVSPTGKTLASGGADGSVYVWDLNSGRCMAQLKGPADQVCSLSFTSHGNMLAGGSLDQAVRLWSVGSRASAFQELQPCKTLRTKSSPVLSVRFTRGNLLMAFGTFTPGDTSAPGGAAAAPKAPKEP